MLETIIAHSDTILLALGIVGGWILNKIRGDQTDSARTMLTSLVRGIVHAEVGDLDDPAVEQKLRDLVAKRAKAWLADRKITGAIADLLLKEAVECAVTELRRLISQHEAVQAAMEKELAKLDAAAQKLLDALNAKPLLEEPLPIEIVRPEVTP